MLKWLSIMCRMKFILFAMAYKDFVSHVRLFSNYVCTELTICLSHKLQQNFHAIKDLINANEELILEVKTIALSPTTTIMCIVE